MRTAFLYTILFHCFIPYSYFALPSKLHVANDSAHEVSNFNKDCNPSIQITASTNNVCIGAYITFTAAVNDAGTSPVYHWKRNGLEVGSNNPTYSTNTLNNNDVIECELETSCSNNVVKSNAIAMIIFGTNPIVTISASPNVTNCGENRITLTAAVTNAANTPTYQWKKNGNDITTGGNGSTLAGPFGIFDTIVCECTCINNCGVPTKVLSTPFTFGGRNDLTPEVSIVATETTICAGTTVNFTAINVSQTSTAAFTWLVNGNTVGTNNTIFTTNSLSDGDKVECIMRVSQNCNPGGTKDYSNPIIISIIPVLNPTINIFASTTEICKGSPISFTALAKDTGSNAVYLWQLNGNAVGNNSDSFSSTDLSNGDMITCMLSIGQQKCSNISSVTSNNISVKVKDNITPVINISTPNNNICSGESATFSASASGFILLPSYQWYLNDNKLSSNHSLLNASSLKDGDKIYCILGGDNSICQSEDTSNIILMTVQPVPFINFNPPDTTIAIGQHIQLHPSVIGNIASFQWQPDILLVDPLSLTPTSRALTSNTIFKLTVQNSEGCVAEKDFTVFVFTKLFMPNSFTPNGDGNNDVFRIPPGVSLKLKEFSIYDRWGERIFTTTDILKGWDGKLNGRELPTNNFVYFIKGNTDKESVLLKGTVLLIR
jgi:gliding motility-associated-like protein